jgi:alkylation response protein AidB-like acyl-CoA dehydrogenase
MDLTLSEEQALLAELARSFTERECPPSRVRAVIDTLDGFDADLWAAMASLGWCGLAIAEQHGGAGQGMAELAVLAEVLGRGAVPSPLLASATLAAFPIAWAGSDAQRDRWLPALASGQAVGTLATVEPAGDGPAIAGGKRLEGTKLLVPWAAIADVVLVATATGLHLVEPARGRFTATRHDDLAAEPLFAVELAGTPAEPLGRGGMEEQRTVLRLADDHAAVTQLAYAVGAGGRALELSVAHARERHQFGRPIGSFQAVAHRCVDMRTDLDACRYLAHRAAWALDRGGDAEIEVGAALAYATEALRAVFAHAHQVHGALGFSTEHDLHLFTRRAKAFELAHGGTARHLERVATEMGLR